MVTKEIPNGDYYLRGKCKHCDSYIFAELDQVRSFFVMHFEITHKQKIPFEDLHWHCTSCGQKPTSKCVFDSEPFRIVCSECGSNDAIFMTKCDIEKTQFLKANQTNEFIASL